MTDHPPCDDCPGRGTLRCSCDVADLVKAAAKHLDKVAAAMEERDERQKRMEAQRAEPPVFVIAGSRREAENWCHENGISRHRLVYLATIFEAATRTMGCFDQKYACVGTWDYRPYREIHPMLDLLKSRGFTHVA